MLAVVNWQEKLPHHTSPRFITYVSDNSLRPFQGFRFVGFILCHLTTGLLLVCADNVWSHQRLDESADVPPSNDLVQTFVHLFVERDG